MRGQLCARFARAFANIFIFLVGVVTIGIIFSPSKILNTNYFLEQRSFAADNPNPIWSDDISSQDKINRRTLLGTDGRLTQDNGSRNYRLGQDFLKYALQPPRAFTPYPNPYNVPILDIDAKLMFCWIPKVACTQFKAFFCKKQTSPDNMTIHDQLRTFNVNTVHSYKHCKGLLQKLNNVTRQQREAYYANPSIRKWAVVRDPMDRLLSGWLDKCGSRARPGIRNSRCYGCSQDFVCFVERNLAFLQRMSFNSTPPHSYIRADHFFPQYWHCDFSHHLPDYDRIFAYSKSASFRKGIRSAFTEIGLPRDIIEHGWGVNGKRPFLEAISNHATGTFNKPSDAKITTQPYLDSKKRWKRNIDGHIINKVSEKDIANTFHKNYQDAVNARGKRVSAKLNETRNINVTTIPYPNDNHTLNSDDNVMKSTISFNNSEIPTNNTLIQEELATLELQRDQREMKHHPQQGHQHIKDKLEQKQQHKQTLNRQKTNMERDSIEKILKSNLTILDTVFKSYFIDYLAFNDLSPLPLWVDALCEAQRKSRTFFICRWIHNL